jgi:CRISPR-associated protein Cmr5
MPRYIKNVEQERAKKAYRFVEAAIAKYGQKSKKAKEYKSYLRSLAMMIKSNGINNTFAFVLAKGKDDNPYQLIDAQMREWFDVKEECFVKYLIHLNSNDYRKITIETLAFLSWLKRLAEGLIEDPTEKEVNNAN